MSAKSPAGDQRGEGSGKDAHGDSNGKDNNTGGTPPPSDKGDAAERHSPDTKKTPSTPEKEENLAPTDVKDDDDDDDDSPAEEAKGKKKERNSDDLKPSSRPVSRSRQSPRSNNNGKNTPEQDIPPALSPSPQTTEGPCNICPQLETENIIMAEFACDSCSQLFCVHCAKRHVQAAVSAQHDVAPLAAIPEDDLVDLADIKCITHPARSLDYFCHGCQAAVCGRCVSFSHGGKDHRLGRVEKLDQHKKTLHTRYEKAIRKNPPSGTNAQSSTQSESPNSGRPVLNLLWKKESKQGSQLKKAEVVQEAECLCGPCDLTFLPRGQLVVADRWNKSVKFFDEDGNNAQSILDRVAPIRLCATRTGRIAIVDDYAGGKIKILSSEVLAKKTPQDFELANEKKISQAKDDASPKQTTLPEEQNGSSQEDKNANIKGESHVSEQQSSQENDGPNKENEPVENTNRKGSSKGSKARGGRESRPMSESPAGTNHVDMNNGEALETNVDVLKNWLPENMRRPWAISVNKYDQWLVSEYEQYSRAGVSIYNEDGHLVKSFGILGDGDDQLEWPSYIASDSRGRIVVSDYWNHVVKVFDHRGNFVSTIGSGCGRKDGQLTFPKGVCVMNDDYVVVVDSGNDRVSEFTPDGVFVRHLLTAADGVVHPAAVAFVQLELEPEPGSESTGAQSANDAESAARENGQLETTNKSGRTGGRLEADQSEPGVRSSGARLCRLALSLSKRREFSAILVYSIDEM